MTVLIDLLKVKVYTMKGQFKLDFGGDDDLQHPSDMTITRDGDVAISDCGSLSVKIFSPFGTLTSQFGSDDVFSLPISLTTDVAGRQERFLVLDQDRQRITIHLSTSGELVKDISVARIQTPQLINTHGCRLYISDFQNDTIHMYSTKDNDVTYVATQRAVFTKIIHRNVHIVPKYEATTTLPCPGPSVWIIP